MFFNSSITISNSEDFKKYVSMINILNLEILVEENLNNEREFQAKTHYYSYI